jgi:hypothetical protein
MILYSWESCPWEKKKKVSSSISSPQHWTCIDKSKQNIGSTSNILWNADTHSILNHITQTMYYFYTDLKSKKIKSFANIVSADWTFI